MGEQDHLQPIPQPTDYRDGEVDFYELTGADGPTPDVRASIWSTPWLSKPRSGTLFDFASLPTVVDEFNASACCHPLMARLSTDVVSLLAANLYPAITPGGTVSPAERGSRPDDPHYAIAMNAASGNAS